MKIICWKFHVTAPFTFWDTRTWDLWKVCLQTFRNNRICYKFACFLRNLQTSRVNNSKILRIKNANFSGYCFIWAQAYREVFKSALVYLQVPRALIQKRALIWVCVCSDWGLNWIWRKNGKTKKPKKIETTKSARQVNFPQKSQKSFRNWSQKYLFSFSLN